MDLKAALTQSIGNLPCPVVTAYQFGTIIFHLYSSKLYKEEKISRIHKDYPSRLEYARLLGELSNRGIISHAKGVSHREVFYILGKKATSAMEVACCIDPFSYVSHLSAMEWHGLTDRIPKIIFISSPPAVEWRRFSNEKMRKDIGDEFLPIYIEKKLPLLRRINMTSLLGKAVNRHSSIHRGAFTTIKGKNLRVSTIGRTFLDMIRDPDLCGGIFHVIDIFEESAEKYLDLIVSEIDRNGKKIDKVRAGYILNDRCHLEHPIFPKWRDLVQRGGSQKLYAKSGYSPDFSEEWSLSINIYE